MKRRMRTEILVRGSADTAAKLALEILKRYEVKMIDEPNNGLVMVKARETAKRSLFYFGEVLVTECKVLINGHLGIGVIKGHDPDKAYNLAVIDAAYNAGLKETERWTEILLAEEVAVNSKQREIDNKILRTKVNFETMDV